MNKDHAVGRGELISLAKCRGICPNLLIQYTMNSTEKTSGKGRIRTYVVPQDAGKNHKRISIQR